MSAGTVFVVMGDAGAYSDQSTWLVSVHQTRALAEARIATIVADWKRVMDAHAAAMTAWYERAPSPPRFVESDYKNAIAARGPMPQLTPSALDPDGCSHAEYTIVEVEVEDE